MTDPQLNVSELFYSIQGESTRAGIPCAFIRLADCNLRCRYCDSAYTWQEPGTLMSLPEIRQWLSDYPEVAVEITGGEPLLQKGIYPLLDDLLAAKREILLETNGSLNITRIPNQVHVILDLKCPGSGMSGQVDWSNIDELVRREKTGAQDEVKFVLSSEDDYIWSKSIIDRYGLKQLIPLLLSPVSDMFPPAKLAELMLRDRIEARLQLQLHRLLWPTDARGV